ncbi:MAG: hypothetical protein A2Z83_03075 [Omnitrophica bacterium GWA2_52_8]|nr:MAG: hypothetical protein A2Z83_03075 [Omnitrophica bacterium GWA2_52_8]
MSKRTVCLVTGGAGFIGSHVAEGLLKRGNSVRILDNLSTGMMQHVQGMRGDVEFIKGDVRDAKAVDRAVRKCDYVFHLAANRAVLQSVEAPLEAHEVNMTGTLKLLLAASRHKIKRLIFTSSSSVYGSAKKKMLREDDLLKPESPYAATKAAGEYYCRIFSRLYGLETVSLRYFNVFGPRQNPESRYSAVIPIFIETVLKGKSPEIHWDGKQSRDFHYVDSVVEANLLAMRARGVSGEAFNIGSQKEYSVNHIFNAIKKILNRPSIKPVYKPKRPGDVRRTLADISKARRLLGYRLQTEFEPGLKQTVDWFVQTGSFKGGMR